MYHIDNSVAIPYELTPQQSVLSYLLEFFNNFSFYPFVLIILFFDDLIRSFKFKKLYTNFVVNQRKERNCLFIYIVFILMV